MKCPFCGYSESKVIDSRPADEGQPASAAGGSALSCAKRFTTYETVESLPMVVVKKDGSRQSFDRRKVLGGMIRACEKRPVPLAELEKIAAEIEQDLQNSMEREISTEAIGEQVMERLRRCGPGGLCAVCLGISPVQGYRYLYGGAEQASLREMSRTRECSLMVKPLRLRHQPQLIPQV